MSARELLALPAADLDALLMRPDRIVFSVGTAEVLGSARGFSVQDVPGTGRVYRLVEAPSA
jgi:hypothetical protein